MRSLKKPKLDTKEVFTTCISKVKNADLKRRLMSIQDIIVSKTNEFDIAAQNTKTNEIVALDNINNTITCTEMIKVYTGRMVPKDSPGRKFYSELRLTPFNKCPFCAQRSVSTLDHYLPKTIYPALAVSPINLIPSCAECNKIKDTYESHTSEKELLHPYYDNISDNQWLIARVRRTKPIVIKYKIIISEGTLIEKRIRNHFNFLQLQELYSSQAGEELSNIYGKLKMLYEKTNKDEVKQYLIEEYESRYVNNINSWQTAMYKALSESSWFCDGGFYNINDL